MSQIFGIDVDILALIVGIIGVVPGFGIYKYKKKLIIKDTKY